MKIKIEVPSDPLVVKFFEAAEGHTAFEIKEAARRFWNLVNSHGTQANTEQNEVFTVAVVES